MFNGKLNLDVFPKKISAHIICSKYFLIFTNHHESCSDITENQKPEYTHLVKKHLFPKLGVILRSPPENNVLTSAIA